MQRDPSQLWRAGDFQELAGISVHQVQVLVRLENVEESKLAQQQADEYEQRFTIQSRARRLNAIKLRRQVVVGQDLSWQAQCANYNRQDRETVLLRRSDSTCVYEHESLSLRESRPLRAGEGGRSLKCEGRMPLSNFTLPPSPFPRPTRPLKRPTSPRGGDFHDLNL